MKTLFRMDIKNYAQSAIPLRRPSARAVIRTEDGKLAMVYSTKYHYYKFPGGGIRAGETKADALIREVREETGLAVRRDTIREYGSVLRVQKSCRHENAVFVQENDYYFCSASCFGKMAAAGRQQLDDYEKEAGFELRSISAEDAVKANRACLLQDDFNIVMAARETQVLERLCGLTPQPPVSMAEFLLREAAKCNPGAWEQHSRYAAQAAEQIAKRCPGLDAQKAYVYGLLHDIGRKFGVSGLKHVYDGYHYLMDLGYDGAARIALTHSFHLKKMEDYIGEFDISQTAQEEIRTLLAEMEYDDYDHLIQLCDSTAKADGIVSLEERMNDVESRYGYYPQEKRDRNVFLENYFKEKMAEGE